MLAAAALATIAFAGVLVRDRGTVPRRMLRAEAPGVAGSVPAVLFMQAVTSSGLGDLGGPVGWLLVVGIFALGAASA